MEPGRQQIRVRLASLPGHGSAWRSLYLGKRELAEHLAKALHRALEQHADRLGHPVLLVEAGAAVDEHHLDSLVGNPVAHLGADAKQVVGAERPVGQHVAGLGQGLDQIVPELSSAAVRLSETVRTAILRGMNSLCLGAIGAIPVNH